MWLERSEQALRETSQVLMWDRRKHAWLSFLRGPPWGQRSGMDPLVVDKGNGSSCVEGDSQGARAGAGDSTLS